MATLPHHSPFLRLSNPPEPNSISKPANATRPRTTRLTIHCKKPKNEEAFKEKQKAHVDYDNGTHRVSVQVSGLRASDLPKRHRLRVATDRFQKDWSISEVVEKIMALDRFEDIEGVLNRWAGRFARKNFQVLIRVSKLWCLVNLLGLNLYLIIKYSSYSSWICLFQLGSKF